MSAAVAATRPLRPRASRRRTWRSAARMSAMPNGTSAKSLTLHDADRSCGPSPSGRTKTALRRLSEGEKLGGRLGQFAGRLLAGLPEAERIVLVRDRGASRGLDPEGVLVKGR